MRKLLTATAAFAFMSSAASACDYHQQHVTASAEQARPSVAISTHDGMLPPIADQTENVAEAATDTACAAGDEGCAPPAKSLSE